MTATRPVANLPLFRIAMRLGCGMTRRGGPGRPSKGDRDVIITRPARPLGDVVRARADEAGLSISEYVASVLAEVHHLPQYAPQARPPQPEELPLSKTA